MTLSEELRWRGFVQHTTLQDLSILDKQKIKFYHGYDASADSQTVGNLAALILDRIFIRHGHEGIILVGGATSQIGDPGGKDKERPLQDESVIAGNISNAGNQISKILEGRDFKLVNNLDWTKDIKLLPFLRDIGKHFSMTPLVQRDYIAKRIGVEGAGISYTEFSYTILQGYDYLYLYDNHGVTLQLGGSDQWGNCLSGVELIRKLRGADVHVITLPLIINKSTGRKFGKSEEGAIWLDEQKTSVFRFYQFWLNASDEGAETYLKIFTELSKEEIDQVIAEFNANRAQRAAQKRLALEVTRLVHGETRTEEVIKTTEVLFGEGDFLELGKNEMHILKNELPVAKADGDLPQIMVNSGLASSKSEARQHLQAGAVFINGQKAGPENLDLFVKGNNLLRKGKNSFAIIEK